MTHNILYFFDILILYWLSMPGGLSDHNTLHHIFSPYFLIFLIEALHVEQRWRVNFIKAGRNASGYDIFKAKLATGVEDSMEWGAAFRYLTCIYHVEDVFVKICERNMCPFISLTHMEVPDVIVVEYKGPASWLFHCIRENSGKCIFKY